jgi:hypothetical protein
MFPKQIIQEEKQSFKLIDLISLNESAKCQVCATEVEKHIVEFNISKHQLLLCFFCGMLADIKAIEKKFSRVKQYRREHRLDV